MEFYITCHSVRHACNFMSSIFCLLIAFIPTSNFKQISVNSTQIPLDNIPILRRVPRHRSKLNPRAWSLCIHRHPVEYLRDGAHVLRRERSVLTPARALGELFEGLRQFTEELANLLKQAVLVVVQIAHELLVRQHRRCRVGHDFLARHVFGVAERVHLVFDQIVHTLPVHKC